MLPEQLFGLPPALMWLHLLVPSGPGAGARPGPAVPSGVLAAGTVLASLPLLALPAACCAELRQLRDDMSAADGPGDFEAFLVDFGLLLEAAQQAGAGRPLDGAPHDSCSSLAGLAGAQPDEDGPVAGGVLELAGGGGGGAVSEAVAQAVCDTLVDARMWGCCSLLAPGFEAWGPAAQAATAAAGAAPGAGPLLAADGQASGDMAGAALISGAAAAAASLAAWLHGATLRLGKTFAATAALGSTALRWASGAVARLPRPGWRSAAVAGSTAAASGGGGGGGSGSSGSSSTASSPAAQLQPHPAQPGSLLAATVRGGFPHPAAEQAFRAYHDASLSRADSLACVITALIIPATLLRCWREGGATPGLVACLLVYAALYTVPYAAMMGSGGRLRAAWRQHLLLACHTAQSLLMCFIYAGGQVEVARGMLEATSNIFNEVVFAAVTLPVLVQLRVWPAAALHVVRAFTVDLPVWRTHGMPLGNTCCLCSLVALVACGVALACELRARRAFVRACEKAV